VGAVVIAGVIALLAPDTGSLDSTAGWQVVAEADTRPDIGACVFFIERTDQPGS
jgi:hypothetical protein